MSLKKLGLAAALSLATLTAQAAPAPAIAQPGVPAALTALGALANPVLQPLLAFSAPVVGPLVQFASSGPAFRLLGALGAGPINALAPTGLGVGPAQAATLPGLE